MAQRCPVSKSRGSLRLERLPAARPLPLRLARCVCNASSANLAQDVLPLGGAIVATLAGSARFIKGAHHLVPLLGPGTGPQPRLPFGASLECVRKNISKQLCSEAPAWSHTASRSAGSDPSPMDGVAGSSGMLDVLYVLAGTGTVSTADGTIRTLHAGDSLVAWHNTTQLHATAADQPPAVLKFHFPASVLMLPPGTVVAPTPSHADLQVLVRDCQGSHDGELSAQDAADMLSGVQQRAAKAIARLYGHQSDSLDEESGPVASSPVAAAASSPVPTPPPAAVEPPSTGASNNIVPVVPFLKRMLHRATAPAAGGIQRLKSVLSQGKAKGRKRPASSAPPAPAAAAARPLPSGCVLLQRPLEDFKAFRFPRQTNKLAFVFDPSELGLSLSFGVEVFEPGHHTPLHIHQSAHELFFVLAGEGVAFCNGHRFTVRAGDFVVFPPRTVHGIDNNSMDSKLYCLQLMTPNESFVEHVKSGEAVGRLDDEDLCNLTSRHC